ncbi:unnamed protein product [Phytomonas sp. Hart1]|nr:unnamed protein product [Phytomonas sp. Hart1]|eukprot:CCW71960.1 unnamed protein product [Phytomonas sp. isolate Hart1]
MYPLTLPREINSLRYFSVIAIFLMMYFVFSVVLHSFLNGFHHGVRKDIVYFQSGNTAVQGLAIFMAAYLSQLNCYKVYDELYKPTVRRLTLTGGISASLCFILYALTGVFGYYDFGAAVTGSALKLYNPIKEPYMGVSYAIIMLKLCVGYGLNMIPLREAIYHVTKVDGKAIMWWKHALFVSAMAVLTLLGGLFLPNVNTAVGLVGGFSGGFISYIFPALMYMYSGNWTLQKVGWFHFVMTYILLICGVIGVVFGTISTIYGHFYS